MSGKSQSTHAEYYSNSSNTVLDEESVMVDFPPREAIKKALGNKKVYLSLTTSPTRLQYLNHVLMSFDSSLLHRIFICIPEHYRNHTNDCYTLPLDLLSKFPKVRIISASYDPGPCLKVVGSVKYLKVRDGGVSPDDLIIYIDDDIAYSSVMVDTLVMLALDIPNSVIGGSGLSQGIIPFGFPPFSRDRKPLVDPALIVEGFAAVIAPIKAIDYEFILAFCDSITPSCTFSDDLIMSWIFAYNGFPIYGIRNGLPLSFYCKNSLKEFPFGNIGALKDKSHDNPEESGFGGNFQRYREAAYILFLNTLDLTTENLEFKTREQIIELLHNLRKKICFKAHHKK